MGAVTVQISWDDRRGPMQLKIGADLTWLPRCMAAGPKDGAGGAEGGLGPNGTGPWPRRDCNKQWRGYRDNVGSGGSGGACLIRGNEVCGAVFPT